MWSDRLALAMSTGDSGGAAEAQAHGGQGHQSRVAHARAGLHSRSIPKLRPSAISLLARLFRCSAVPGAVKAIERVAGVCRPPGVGLQSAGGRGG